MSPGQDMQGRFAALLPKPLVDEADPTRAPLAPQLLRPVEHLLGKVFEKLDAISDYSNPERTDPEFLPWLASWMGLALRTDWTESQQREVLRQILPLYRMRGTRQGIEQYLKIYVGDGVHIPDEDPAPFKVGTTRIGGDQASGVIGGVRPYHFVVNVKFASVAERQAKTMAVTAVLNIEKPAHTTFWMNTSGPTFRIGSRSRVGRDTLL